MEEANEVFLSDGGKIVLEDDDDIILSFISNDKTEDTFQFPEPSGGYGGGSLKLSPSEKYLIFSYFSGESDEAFSLFELKDSRLTFLYDSGYLYGEEAEYSFADDEKLIVQTFRPGYRRVPPGNAMGRGNILRVFAGDPYGSV